MVAKKSWLSRIFTFRASEDQVVQQEGDQKVIVIHREPIGSTGTKSYAGYPAEEYLARLQSTQRADIFDQMRRSDPQVKMCLSSVKNPIKAAIWEVEPADDSDESKQDAEFIEHVLFNDMDQSWGDFLGEALTVCEFGHSVFEITHKVVMNHPKFGSYNGIRSLGFRSQRTIQRWNLDPQTGKLVSVSQYAYGDLQRLVDIPAEFLLVFSLDKEGSNYEGISLLRPCYGSWFRKNTYLKLNAIGIEKFAIPTPMAEIPEGQQNSDQFANLTEALENYMSHEKGYLTYPAGWKINLQTNSYDPEKVEVSIDNEDKRMVKSFLANFLELGMNSSGSFALSNDLSDFFLSGLDHLASLVTAGINQKIIPDLIRLNRGNRQAYPKLKHSGISDKAGKELSEVVERFARTQVIIPDDALEDHIRKRYGLPKKTDQGVRAVKPEQQKQAVGETLDNEPTSLAERIRLAEKKRLGSLRRG